MSPARQAFRLLLLLLLLLPLVPVHSSSAERGGVPAHALPATVWMSVRLGRRHIGSLVVDRQTSGRSITTTQTMALRFTRAGSTALLGSMARTVEDVDGTALGFAASSSLSSQTRFVQGRRIAPQRFEVTTRVGGSRRKAEIRLPPRALMFDAQRRAAVAAGWRPGTRYLVRAFDPNRQRTDDSWVEVIGDEPITLPGGTRLLSHQRQRSVDPGGDGDMDVWLDAQGIAWKARLNLLGMPLELVACSRACATAPVDSVDMLEAALVPSPRPLSPALRAGPLTYRIHVDKGNAQPFARTGEQRFRPLARGRWELLVGSSKAGPPPSAADLESTDWLQSDDASIRALAAQAVGDARGDPRPDAAAASVRDRLRA